MAKEQFNADIELGGHKIKQVKIDPMSNADRVTLAGTLGVNDKGRAVYDEDDELLYVWTGTVFTVGNLAADWSTITNKPTTFPPSAHTHVEADITDLDKYTQAQVDAALALKVNSSEKGIPAGVATLGIDGKVPTSQLPDSVQGDMTYKGGWNASTNTPTITSGVGENGDFFRVIFAGTTLIDGVSDWQIGDSLIFNEGTGKWEKFDGSGVNSVFGRQGNVTAQAGDYNASKITNDSSVSGTTVKAALDNLDSDKADLVHTHDISDINALETTLNEKLEEITNDGAAGIDLVKTKSGVTQGIKGLLGTNGITIVDSTTYADTVEISGPTPSAALANSDHGSILNVSNTTNQSIAAGATVKVNTWDSNGPSQQGVVPTFSLGRLTISANGTYLLSVLGGVRVSNNVPVDVTLKVYKNGSPLTNFQTTVTLTSTTEEVQFSKTIPITAVAADYFELFISHSGALTTSILIRDSVLLASKQDVANGFATWGNISGTLSNQTDLQAALDAKATLSHTHVEADITDLDKYTQAEVDSFLSGKAALVHTHTSTEVTNSSTVSGATVTAALDWLKNNGGAWGTITGILSNQTDLQAALDAKLNAALKGAINGVAELDGSGRIPVNQLPTSVMEYKGVWNANTNSPALSSGVGTNGDYYLIGTAGTTSLDGESDWGIGDAVIFNGTLGQWQKVGRDDLVTSVFGRVGVITAQAGDYDASQIDNDSTVSGATVKDALDNLFNSKISEVVEDTTPQLGGNLDLNGNDINGTGNVDITGNVIADIVKLRGGVGTQGEMSWSVDEETVQLVMDGTTLHIGQDTFVHARNNTDSIITKGTAVYATGTLGASGRITVAPMIADGSIPGRYFIGLAAEDIAIGADGQVMTFGKIRQVDTSTFNDGDVLWLSDTVPGGLTTTQPTAPNLKIATAFVIHAANNGTLMVRAEQGNDLHSDQRVQVSGLTDGDVLTWSNANQRWENEQPVDTNFANTNLTLTGNRTHNLNGNSLNINNGATNVFTINEFNDVIARGKGTTNNNIIGFNTARSLTSSDVTILGDLAGQSLTTGGNNVLLGRSAGQGLTTGPSNVMIGRDAGLSLTTISESVFIGRDAGRNIPGTPNRSVVIGAQAMRDGGGTDNTAIGNQALLGGGTQFNVAVGALAGSTNVGGGTNVFIGYNAQPLSDTNFGSIVIGGSSVGYGSNTAVLGASTITLTRLRGRVEMNQITSQPTITDNSSYAIWFNSGNPTIRLKNNLGVESNITLWNNNNDGAGSGLDADLLDGVQGANYLQKTSNFLSKTFTLEAPTASDDITIFRTDVAITVVEVIAVSVGTTPSTTYQLKHSTDRDAAGSNLTTSSTTTSKTTGDIATLSVAAIPANSWIWLETTAASGTNVKLTIDIRYTID